MDERDKDFLEFVVKNIVDHPDDVEVARTIDERGVLLSLKVHPEDMGQVIGREGSTAKAMRALLRTIGAKNDARVNLKIIEPEGSTRGHSAPAPQGDTVPVADEVATKGVDEIVDELK